MRCGGHCEEPPRHSSFNEGLVDSDAGSVVGRWTLAARLSSDCLSCRVSLLGWSKSRNCGCESMYVWPSSTLWVYSKLSFNSRTVLRAAEAVFESALQINFLLCSTLLSSPLFRWCWSQRHLLSLQTKFSLMVCFTRKLWFEENRYSERERPTDNLPLQERENWEKRMENKRNVINMKAMYTG